MDDHAPSERSDHRDSRYAVIGRSDNEPILYHMNLSWVRAHQLRARREALTDHPCYVIPMSAWHENPLTALQRAEQMGTP